MRPEDRPDPLAMPGEQQQAPPANPANEAQAAMDRMGGLHPQWKNLEGDKTPDDDHGCVVYIGSTLCGQPRAWIALFGCLAERHWAPSDVCEGHIGRASRSVFTCQACKDETGETVLAKMLKKERVNDDDPDDPAGTAARLWRQPREVPG